MISRVYPRNNEMGQITQKTLDKANKICYKSIRTETAYGFRTASHIHTG